MCLLLLVCVSFFSFSRFRQRVLDDRLLLARTVAHYLDSTISDTFRELGRLSSHLSALDAGEVTGLRNFRFQGLFREAIYILDDRANVLVSDPPGAEPLPPDRLTGREAVTRAFHKSDPNGRLSLAIIQPFRREGKEYYLVSEMNPLGLHVTVSDANGVVIAARDQKQLFRVNPQAEAVGDRITSRRPYVSKSSDCNVCEESNERGEFITIMAPLRFAPWGVVVQQQKKKAFSALYTAQYGFLAAGTLLVIMGVFLSNAMAKSVIAPIQALSRRADLLRRGDLVSPVAVTGDREVELLALAMDEARKRLGSTLSELQLLNENLEGLVARRTRVLREQYDNLKLLHEVSQITTREREPERFIRQVLDVISRHSSFHAVAMVTTPPDAPPTVYTFPEEGSLSWLANGTKPPAGWEEWRLEYQGKRLANFFYRRGEKLDERVMEALRQQLAISLHSAYLLQRTLVQDAQRRVLVRRLLDAGEEERRRIARELHDETSQLLTLIQLSLENVGGDHAEIKKAKELLAETQKEIHRIIYDLRPSLLDDLGLSAAVKWYADNSLSRKGLQVNLEIEDDLRLPPEIEISTFRIYQEIVTNILRHSKAESVSIELYATDDRLLLAVEDDGVGFSHENRSSGAGIAGMRERAALVKGTITFDSEPDMGTHVLLEIPLQS
jgi:signal transduction histidine kinase